MNSAAKKLSYSEDKYGGAWIVSDQNSTFKLLQVMEMNVREKQKKSKRKKKSPATI
jgi:hypothetical protein